MEEDVPGGITEVPLQDVTSVRAHSDHIHQGRVPCKSSDPTVKGSDTFVHHPPGDLGKEVTTCELRKTRSRRHSESLNALLAVSAVDCSCSKVCAPVHPFGYLEWANALPVKL